MKRSDGRILTTHAGSLSRPDDLLAMNRARQTGQQIDEAARAARIRTAVAEVVAQQVATGLDSVNDGEFSKFNFLDYSNRFSGFGPSNQTGGEVAQRRDFQRFAAFYNELYPGRGGVGRQPMCVGPITYIGQAALQADIDNMKAALAASPANEAFMSAIAPGTLGRGVNQHYKDDETFLFAIAEALRTEYEGIVNAGFVLQIDDPGLPDTWDSLIPEPSVAEYRSYAQVRIDALNHALANVPEDRVRYHICWGSWHGPHTTDIELADIVDVMLSVKAGAYSLEAGNVRHEMDWRVWEKTKLPGGKIIIPGVVSHATNVVEHPDLVADRIVRYSNLVGREYVVAGTDCGMGGRIHPSLAWAKFEALVEGAKRASKVLWS
jgi:5-methyltetrahydropteroyltriglutamate--homocysteine methyltransferase